MESEKSQPLKAQEKSAQYPLAFSRGLTGLTPKKRRHAPHPDMVIMSMKYCPSSWFAHN